MGIEPTAQAWEAWVLPLYDARRGVIIAEVSAIRLKGAYRGFCGRSPSKPTAKARFCIEPRGLSWFSLRVAIKIFPP